VTVARWARADTRIVGSLAARAYLAFGSALVALHFAVGGSRATYDAVGVSAVLAIVAGTIIHRPARWRGWAAIAVGQVLFVAGDFVYNVWPTFPSPADAVYLASYAMFLVGILLLMGRSFAWSDIAGHLDTLLVLAALGLAAWMLTLDERFQLRFALGPIVALAYPVGDLLLLGLLIRIWLAPGRRPASYWLMLAAVLPLFVSDATYVLPALGDSYALGSWLDAGWLGCYVLLGAAALHPSMGSVASTDGRRMPTVLALRRVVVGGLALLLVPISVIVEDATRGGVDVILVGAGGTILLAGMLVRAALLVRELDALRVRAEESERKFRLVFERAPIGISVGRDGIMSETNPALHRMLGYTSQEFARMHYTEVTHPDDQDLAAQGQLDAHARDAFALDKRYVRKDGSELNTHVHVALDLEDGLGISLIEDVTERRELEEQLLQSQKMEAVGKLAGGIAHDFNNLMTAVLGSSDLLLRTLQGHDRERVLAIRECAVRASDLTRQLLAFGRRQMLQTANVDLRDVVERMDSLLRRPIGEDIVFETFFDDDEVIVRADPTQLEQVVTNLVVNARDAMPEGGTLTIAVGSDGKSAVLSVADDGVGMDADTLARIYEPFFSTKPLVEASGLGLSTVHGIVGQSGGTIDVQSVPGQGTSFTVRLPLAGAVVLPSAPPAATVV
jgi:PAS domain S-box-containing protein